MSFDAKKGQTRTGGRPASKGVIRGLYSLSVGMPDTLPPDGWHWIALSEIARLESGHTPSRKHPEYWGGGIPWIGIRDATKNHGSTLQDTEQHTNALGIANSSARILPATTVCLSRTASVGYVVVMGQPMATSQDFVNWICSSEIDFRFLKYILLSEHKSMLRFASGTTHQTIYFPEAKAFHVCIPNSVEQKRVADVLQSLDDRIALLRETNATLEAIAQALFKSWFIDFDPVRAKLEGRTPEGMDGVTASLFPEEWESSESELIPKGWRVGNLEDCCIRIESGGTPKRTVSAYWNGDVSWLTSGEVRSPIVFDTKERISAVGMKESSAKLWPSGSTVVAMYGATAGEACLLAEPMTANQACCGLIPKANFRAFLFSLVRRERESLAAKSSGSAQQNLNKGLVAGHQTLLPTELVVAAYEEVAGALLDSWMGNEKQAQTLAALRDTLLPRLMSGKLRLPELVRNFPELVAA